MADALGLHLDLFQRIVVDPASVTVIRYTPLRPFLVRLNDTGGTSPRCAAAAPRGVGARRGRPSRTRRSAARAPDSPGEPATRAPAFG